MSMLAADNTMKKLFLIVLIPMMLLALGTSLKKPEDTRKNLSGYVPKTGFVPNAATAIKIAEAVWFPIYGKSIYTKKPYKVSLKNNIWIVEGSIPANHVGGVPYIEIQKTDARILKVMHSK